MAARVPVLRHRDFRLLFTGQAVSRHRRRAVARRARVRGPRRARRERRRARARARRAGRADDVPRPAGRRVGGPDVAPHADARLRPRPRRRPGASRRRCCSPATRELWHLIVLSAAYGALEAFFRPAAGGLTPALVPPDELQQANSLVGLAQNAGHVLGPAAAGALIVVLSPGAAIAVDAATFVVSAAFLVALREPAREPHPPEHVPALLGRAQGRDRRGPAAPLDARLHARRSRAYHLVALPCVLALGAVLADEELGGAGSWAIITSCFGAGTIARLDRRAALEAARARCWRRALAFVGASLPAGDHRARRLDRRDRRVRGARRHRRRDRLRPVGDDARPADPRPGALPRDVARLVHDRRADAARLRDRRPDRRRRRPARDDGRRRGRSPSRCSWSRSPCATCARCVRSPWPRRPRTRRARSAPPRRPRCRARP